jgi:hypothetical protein
MADQSHVCWNFPKRKGNKDRGSSIFRGSNQIANFHEQDDGTLIDSLLRFGRGFRGNAVRFRALCQGRCSDEASAPARVDVVAEGVAYGGPALTRESPTWSFTEKDSRRRPSYIAQYIPLSRWTQAMA